MLLSVEDLPALLTRAANRQEAGGAGRSLLTEFAGEVVQATGGKSLRLIEITSNSSRVVCTVSAPGSADRASQAERTSGLEAVIRQIQADKHLSLARSSGDDGRFLAMAEITSGIALLVEFNGGAGGTAVHDGIAEICADLHRRESLSELRQAVDRRQMIDPFVASLYACRDPHSLSDILATDGAALLGCRRISVCERMANGDWRLVASTSVNQPNARADAVQAICRMISDAERTASSGPPSGPGPGSGLVAARDAGAISTWVCSLNPAGDWERAEYAALFEWDASQSPDRTSLAAIRLHAAQALQSIEQTTGSVWKITTRLLAGYRRSRLMTVAGGLLLVVAFLLLWPMELTIEGNGVLEPSRRKYLWAADEGIVTEVPVVDGQEVESNTELIRIRNEELQLQLETILGDLATARARLAAIEALRVGRESSRDPQLLSEQSEVSARIQSLEEQSRILDQRIQTLTVVSPLKGRFFGASLKERFLGRPVVRGQYFGEVADLSEAWEIRLQVRESDVRHLLDAVKSEGDQQSYPEVTFALATQPEVFSTIRITQISPTTKLDSYGNLTTEVTARLTELPADVNRPGTGVLGRIHCGKRSAGYVCFRRMIDYVSRTVFL